MKKLKLNLDKDQTNKLEQQLHNRVEDLEKETTANITRLEESRKQEDRKLEQSKNTKIAHLKYFHNHVIKRLKLRSQDFEEKLNSRLSTLQHELELKNKLLDGTATSSDVEKSLATLNADNQKLLQGRDRTIETLTKDLNELKRKLDDNVLTVK